MQQEYLSINVFHLAFSITKKVTKILCEHFLGVASYFTYEKKAKITQIFLFFWTYFHNFLCFLAHTQVLASFCSRKRSTLWSTLGYREVGGELYYSIAQ